MKRFGLLKPLLAVLVVLVFSGVTSIEASAEEPYVIGAFTSATGFVAFLGGPMRDGMQLGVDLVNEAGGINGHPLKMIFYDDGSDPSKAVLVVRKLVDEDKVLAVVGGTMSGNVLAVIPYVEKRKISLVSLAAATAITEPVKKWVFGVAHTNALATKKIVEYIVKHNIKRVAFLPDNTAYGDDAYKCFMRQKPDSIEVPVRETYDLRDTDFTPQLTKVKAAGVEAAIVWTAGPPASLIVKNALMLGMKIPFFYTHAASLEMYPILAGEGARLMMIPSAKLPIVDQLPDSDPQKHNLLDFRMQFVKRYKYGASWVGAHGTDAVMITAEAMKRAGWPPDRAKIRDEIERTKNFVGINGIYGITPTNHNSLTYGSITMLKWQKGHYVLAE